MKGAVTGRAAARALAGHRLGGGAAAAAVAVRALELDQRQRVAGQRQLGLGDAIEQAARRRERQVGRWAGAIGGRRGQPAPPIERADLDPTTGLVGQRADRPVGVTGKDHCVAAHRHQHLEPAHDQPNRVLIRVRIHGRKLT